jgi:antagonist of KipI
MIEVLQPGLLTTVQDAGRRGYEAYGFPHSGFFDPFLAAAANRLVGNPIDAPLLEFAMIGPTLAFHRSTSIAISGLAVAYECEQQIPEFKAIAVQEGNVLRFKQMKGWFGYLAVSGGIVATKMLGSVSTHFAGGLGKRLEKGGRLNFGESAGEIYELRSGYWSYPEDPVLHLLPAHHTSEFQRSELQKITSHSYRIHLQSNRMGIRLEGASVHPPALKRSVPALTGIVQVPGSGMPIVLGPEGPTTGGYAQIGMLSRTSWTVLAGKRPGDTVRFDWIDVEKARQMWQVRRNLLTMQDAWRRL